jgi:3-deoxy-D-manno-octulosonate 8-phosphate phosphatase (KDO 8-P phosphatase)
MRKGLQKMRIIKLLILDIDGTLTDGKLYFSAKGEFMKAFNIKDGLILADLAQYDIVPVVITGRKSKILSNRCKELHITEVYQGIADKVKQLRSIVAKYHCSFDEVAYIGDDLNDLECMKLCGISGCPADAVDQVKKAVDYVCVKNGGDGAVREFIEYFLLKSSLQATAIAFTKS